MPEGLMNMSLVSFPLGLPYISSSLKTAGYEVHTLCLDNINYTIKESLESKILENNIDVICTGGLSRECKKISRIFETAKIIKPDIITILGGGIISSDPETAMEVIHPDFGVIGEGEETICELAYALENKSSFDKINGIIYFDKNERLIKTDHRKEINDLDSLPLPDFDGFQYQMWSNKNNHLGFILSERSCPYNCTFCFHPTGNKYRQRSLDNIFKEIDYQIENYGINYFAFIGELFSVNENRILQFCEKIKPYNINWTCCLRVADANDKLIKRMKECGCVIFATGFESADDKILKSMRKGTTSTQIENAVNLTFKYSMQMAGSFIFGDKEETIDSVTNTLDFWWKCCGKVKIDLGLLIPFPGTYLYNYACENNIIKDKKKYLLEGCKPINISRLSDSEYFETQSLISELNLHSRQAATSIDLIHVYNETKCLVRWNCRHCSSENENEVHFWFTASLYCSSCGGINEITVFKKYTDNNKLFYENIDTPGSIAIWGAGGIFYEFSHSLNCFHDKKYILVDNNIDIQGMTRCRKIIYSPQKIQELSIHSVIILALSQQNEIVQMIQNQFPSIKSIHIPSFEISNGVPRLLTKEIVL